MNKYKKRIIIKILLRSLIISFTVSALIFAILLFANLALSIVCSSILFIILCVLLFKIPSTIEVAREIDNTGKLKQRVVTMEEYKNDNSLITKMQRENTNKYLKTFDVKSIKIISKTLTLLLVVGLLFIFSSIAVKALTEQGVIEISIPKKEYKISYNIVGEGSIEGELQQTIFEGEDTNAVYAIPEDNWFFIGWSDGKENPYRIDKCVNKDNTISAIFAKLDEEDVEEEQEDEDKMKKVKSEDDFEFPLDLPIIDDFTEDSHLNSSGKYMANNQIIDGNTYYGDSVFNNAYADAIENLKGKDNITTDVINEYYKNIQK